MRKLTNKIVNNFYIIPLFILLVVILSQIKGINLDSNKTICPKSDPLILWDGDPIADYIDLMDSQASETIIIPDYCTLPLPQVEGLKKTFMDYRKITREGSEQLKLQARAYTDHQGFRKVDDYYLVAMGTFYVENIGDRFEIEIGGKKFIKVMAGDVKADQHTDSKNQYHSIDKSVIEFIVDTRIVDKKIIETGDCSHIIGHGAVTRIERGGQRTFTGAKSSQSQERKREWRESSGRIKANIN